MPQVNGVVRHADGSPALGLTVRAFDRDMRHEQLLGHTVIDQTSGRYVIHYSAESFRRAEKKSADLFIGVFDQSERLRAQSDIVFNAGETERIDLVIKPLDEPRERLSELERLEAALEGVREDVPYREFNTQDREFLTEELIRRGPLGTLERRRVRERLDILAIADALGEETGILLAAFYGWMRQDLPRTLGELLAIPAERLRRALELSIEQLIIPDITSELDAIMDRVTGLRLTAGDVRADGVTVRVIGVMGAEQERVLAGIEVRAVDLEAQDGSASLGTVTTDRTGIATIAFMVEAGDDGASVRQLELTLVDNGAVLAVVPFEAPVGSDTIVDLRVPLESEPGGAGRVADVAPSGLADRLDALGIETFDQVLANPDLPADDDAADLARVRAHAEWAALAPDFGADERRFLIDNAILGSMDFARRSRAEVVRGLSSGLGGDGRTYARFIANRERVQLFQHQIAGMWLENVTHPDDEDRPTIPDGIGEIFEAARNCGCEDCMTAVSPAAYLAQLIDWTLTHVKDGDADINFADLVSDLHQPFGQLPASCRAVEEEVRQVRLVVESLWRFTELRETADLQLPTPTRLAYRAARNGLYAGILNQLGVSFDQLRIAILELPEDGIDAERIESARAGVAARLGIEETHLSELFFNIEQPPISPSEDDLETLFGFKNTRADDPMSVPGRADLLTWQRERLAEVWQAEDHIEDAYHGEGRLPFVDPLVITADHLRTPAEENPAHALLVQRQEEIANHRTQMQGFDPLANGVGDLVESVLGAPADTLRTLAQTLSASEAEEDAVVQAQSDLDALNLTQAGLAHIVEVDGRLEAGEPLGETDDEVGSAIDQLFDILSRAHRYGRHGDWVEEEDNLSLVFGPRPFWLPVEPPAAAPAWQASPAERSEWEDALRQRMRPPLIDPDQITLGHITAFRLRRQQLMHHAPLVDLVHLPALRPVELYEERREFIDGRLDLLADAEQGAADPASRLEAALQASTTGLTTEILEGFAAIEDEGTDLVPFLAQRRLDFPAYRFLDDARLRAAAGAPISADDRAEVRAILVNVEKRLAFADWTLEERSDEGGAIPITLHPNRFRAREAPAIDTPQARWLFDAPAFEEWHTRLTARSDQFDALEKALENAVSGAEGEFLPRLRDILILAADNLDGSLAERAAFLDRRLLMDMKMGGCAMTTRVAHAIETLQRLVRGVYQDDHIQALSHLTLDAVEDYEAEWGTIGDYRDWRAVMLLYLFPENSLHVMPMYYESEAMSRLKAELPRDVGPNEACAAAHEFSTYFADVSTLRTEAACQALARLPGECGAGRSYHRVLTFVFARSRESGRVYVGAFAPLFSTDLVYQWSHVAKAGEVERIVGATAHTTPAGRRYVLLFVITEFAGDRSLEYLRYDLDDLTWSKTRKLKLPNDISGFFRAEVVQKRPNAYATGLDDFSPAEDFPTIVVIEDGQDILYERRLADDAIGWAGSWRPLHGRRVVDDAFLNDPFRLAGVVQRDADEYVVLIEKFDGHGVFFRTRFTGGLGRDDLIWRRVQDLANYRGTLGMALSQRLAVFSNQGAFMRYRVVRAAGDLDGETDFAPWDTFESDIHGDVETTNIVSRIRAVDKRLVRFIKDFDQEFLRERVGISFADIDLSGISVSLFAPTEVGEVSVDGDTVQVENPNPFDPVDPSVATASASYTLGGTFLDLLTMERDDISIVVPSGARYTDKFYYFVQLLDAGLKEFNSRMNGVGSANLLGSRGAWRLADEAIGHLSTRSNDSLREMVGRLVGNRITGLLRYLWGWAHGLSDAADPFGIVSHSYQHNIAIRRRTGSESGAFNSIIGNWRLPHHSGDGSFGRGASAETGVVLAQERATYLTKLVRDGQQLSYKASVGFRRVTADNEGPYTVAPLRSRSDLELRRAELRSVYRENGSALVNATPAARTLLREAYNLVPIALGLALQRSGHFEEALAYFRLIFDDRQPAGERRIDYGLELERDLDLTYDDAEEYFGSRARPHTIAATRRNSYTRQILIMIARCMIEYADALFTNDTGPDNARARELYTRALELLGMKVLRPGTSPCADIIGSLEVELVEGSDLPVAQFMVFLAEIADPVRLRTAADQLVAAANSGTSAAARLAEMQSVAVAAIEAEPAPRSQEEVRARHHTNLARIEQLYLAHRPSRALSRQVMERRTDTQIDHLAEALSLDRGEVVERELPFLREQRPATAIGLNDLVAFGPRDPEPPDRERTVAAVRAAVPLATINAVAANQLLPTTGASFEFCVPQNPVIQALRGRAEANLAKLRTCRNIAGMVRPVDIYGAPIAISAGMVSADGRVFSGVVDAPPTIYRYSTLVNRAKELVGIAQQIEAGYQAALERAEEAALSVLQAENNVELAEARVVLQDLRIGQASSELTLVGLQRGGAALRERTYGDWIAGGKNEHERALLDAYRDAGRAQQAANAARAVGAIAGITASAVEGVAQAGGIKGNIMASAAFGLRMSQLAAVVGESVATGFAIDAQTRASVSAFEANFERQNDQWALQQGLAAVDLAVADQQAVVAQIGLEIAQQERVIAGLEYSHAVDVLRFLTNRTFNEEMYRWIASVLEDVYRFFLQEAASVARLAERQLAFERQQGPLKVIQSNYWTSASAANILSGQGNADRLGLTGSARLLKDIFQLDGFAMESRQPKQTLTITLDLAERHPLEFQRFRETGSLVFATPLSIIDEQMPGYHLCLIRRVSVTVIALVNPSYGIRASLTSSGISRAVVGGDTFQSVTIRNLPERIALTSASTTTGVVELEPDAASLTAPFEGSGFEMLWSLSMPPAANPMNFNSIATVLFTVEMGALHSFDYEREVIARREKRRSLVRLFDFKDHFPDAFYDLNNPDLTDTPMSVRFETQRDDFPSNLSGLRIDHVVLYFVRRTGERFEQEVSALTFDEAGGSGGVGGPAASVDGRISTRSGNGVSWLPMIGRQPVGAWQLTFDDDEGNPERARERLADEAIENILLAVTVSGETAG